jgi:hypothetical protein
VSGDGDDDDDDEGDDDDDDDDDVAGISCLSTTWHSAWPSGSLTRMTTSSSTPR